MIVVVVLRHDVTNHQYQFATYVEDMSNIAELAEKQCAEKIGSANYKYIRYEICDVHRDNLKNL